MPTSRYATRFGPLNIYSATATDHYYSFKLDDWAGYQAYSQLYNEYCFKWIDISFEPVITEVPKLPASANAVTVQDYLGDFYVSCWVDPSGYDNPATTVASLQATAFQTPAVHRFKTTETHKFRMYPKPQPVFMQNLNPVVYNAGTGKGTNWFSTSNPSIPHYGIWIVGPQAASLPAVSSNNGWLVNVTYVIEFRQQE